MNAWSARTEALVSAITAWEVFMLQEYGHIELGRPAREWFENAIAFLEISVIAVDSEISWHAVQLPWQHRDPADRWIVATALRHRACLVTRDDRIRKSRLLDVI
jgi:PIN domain nuclease of toxin-antitoxin system